MFSLSGDLSREAVAAEAVIENCGLSIDQENDSSVAITAYRLDHPDLDAHFYLTAFVGLREKEPMFGPLRRQTDYRVQPDGPSINDSYGFRQREAVCWAEKIQEDSWRVYISGRDKTNRQDVRTLLPILKRKLERIFAPEPSPSSPLFPDLWHLERITRDKLRDKIHACVPGTSLEDIAAEVTSNLSLSFASLLNDVSVGIYLDTGDKWRLCSSTRPWCEEVEKHDSNAFTWVGYSTRPVLVEKNPSACWINRLQACGHSFETLLNKDDFHGLCLVPLLYGPERKGSFGLLELTSSKKDLKPAHLLLLSRLSSAVSGYLFPLMPLPGFPWWPETKSRRGGAKVTVDQGYLGGSVDVPKPLMELAKNFAEDLMPNDASVTLSPLKWGHSGAQVYRLDVQDQRGIAEVPRVLKIGPSKLIRQELKAYYRYVHNKAVGSDARIDVARPSNWPVNDEHVKWFLGGSPDAIVYTLVGFGDRALPWSNWARHASMEELKRGLEMLYERLHSWYSRTREAGASKNIVELMIDPLADGKLESYLKDRMTVPTVEEVRTLIDDLQTLHTSPTLKASKTCVVHGDLHADNIFAVLDSKEHIKSVGLIDWASVRSGWHQLSDISKLMVDLAYRIRPERAIQKLCRNVVEDWGKKLGCHPADSAVALVHQIAKHMFYAADSRGEPWMSDNARRIAWTEIRNLTSYCQGEFISSAASPRRKHRKKKSD